jgi:hypothetical protein
VKKKKKEGREDEETWREVHHAMVAVYEGNGIARQYLQCLAR